MPGGVGWCDGVNGVLKWCDCGGVNTCGWLETCERCDGNCGSALATCTLGGGISLCWLVTCVVVVTGVHGVNWFV